MNLNKKQNIPNGAAVLALGGIIVKIIGAFYKIPIGAMLGPVGMANFSIAYNIYSLLFVISTAGVPTAVSKMVAESLARGKNGETEKILKVSKFAFAGVGLIGFTVLFAGADTIAGIMGNPSSAEAIKAISPAVFFVSLSAVDRGYFQGHSDMYPTAISEVIEALGKLVFGLLVAYVMEVYSKDTSHIAAGAVAGVSTGAFFSVLYFIFKKRSRAEKATGNGRGILKRLISISCPITLGAAVIALTAVIDSALVMNILQSSGETEYSAKWLFGAYNYATTLFTLPSAIIATLATTLMPVLSAMMVQNKKIEADSIVNSGVRLAVLISALAAFGIYALADGILTLLFGSGADGDCIKLSASLLRYLSVGIVPLALVTVTNSVHQALGRVNIPVIAITVGGAVKLISNLILVKIPEVGIHGAAISTVLCYIVALLINLIALKKFKFIGISIFNSVINPVIPGVIVFFTSGSVNGTLLRYVGVRLSTVVSVVMGGVVGVFAVFLLKTLKKDDAKLLFGGKNILKIIDNG